MIAELNTMIEAAEKIPMIWGLLGVIVGAIATAIVWFLVQKRFGSALASASDNLVKLQTEQVTVLKETLQMQKDHYEAEAKEVRTKYEKDLTEVKARSDDYEKRLHDRRNDWNAEKLTLTEELVKCRERPDVGTIKDLIESQTEAIKTMSGTLEQRTALFNKLDDSLSKTVDLQQKILDAVTAHDQKVDNVKAEVLASLGQGRKRKKPAKKKR